MAINTHAKDPICGMEVEIIGSTPKTTYNGVEYYFCCSGCLKRFEKDPETYLASGKQAEGMHGHHCGHGHGHHHGCCHHHYE